MTKRHADVPREFLDMNIHSLQPIRPFDVAALFRRLWRGKWIIALSTLSAVILAVYYAFAIAQPQYAATTTIQIEPPQNNASEQASFGNDTARLNTQAAILRSEHILKQVVIDLDLLDDPEFNRYLTPIAPWSIASIRNRTRAFLSGVSDVPPDNQAILAKTIENLAKLLTSNPKRGTYILEITATTSSVSKSRLIADSVTDAYLFSQIAANTSETDAVIVRLADRVAELREKLQTQESAINALVTDGQMRDHTVLDTLSRQAAETDKQITEARRNLTLHPENADQMSVQIQALETYRDQIGAQVSTQSEGFVTLQQLSRETEITRVLYTTLLAQLQDTQMRRGLNSPSGRILSPAGNGRHVAPRRMLILAIAAILGAAIGIAIVLLRQQRFVNVDTIEDVIAAPVIAQFPRTKPQQLPEEFEEDKSSLLLDAANQLRAAVLISNQHSDNKVILTTSCRHDADQTTVTTTLATSLARLQKSVLIINAVSQPRTPPASFALTDVVTGITSLSGAVISHPTLAIDTVDALGPQGALADLFSSDAFKPFICDARANYDYVIVNAPPVIPKANTRILAQFADMVLLNLRQNRTLTRDAVAAYDTLIASQSKGVKIVLS
ncbi:GumC family protein [Yoonia maritima]|uniref:GumC family protein n=1 Tax=Yoonia maritima TaxID=1435347 RepID=UPI000D1041C9|nr:Wzz/FepE/Etk N-terminal domain-containing protein [Yoonia maritima]